MGNSDYLFVKPSFLNGIARTFDLFGNFTEYNISENGEEADMRALLKDGQAIREDMSAAFQQFEAELQVSGQK